MSSEGSLDQDLIVAQDGAALALLQRYAAPKSLLVVISGPSGVGKDSVINRMRELGEPFHFVVTATNRCPRPGEVHGVDYYFVTTTEFEDMIACGEFLEWANVYGQYKGVPREHARRALATGADVLMRVDLQGAATLRQAVPEAVTVFLAPPSLQVLLEHLRRRGSDSPEQVRARLRMALSEVERAPEFDYVVVNHEGDLDGTVQVIMAIIQAERCRIARGQVVL